METTKDDPHAMLHPSGRYMVHRMHMNARLRSQARPPPRRGSPNDEAHGKGATPEPAEQPVPRELQCPMCQKLLRVSRLAGFVLAMLVL